MIGLVGCSVEADSNDSNESKAHLGFDETELGVATLAARANVRRIFVGEER